MRVRNLTLTTASAAALTIGLTSPALAAAFQSDETAGLHHRAQHVAVYPAAHQALGAHAPVLARGGDDDDDGDGDGGLDPCVAGGCFGGNNNGGGGGILPWAAFGDDDGCGGGGCGGTGNGVEGGSAIGGAPGGGGFGHQREVVKKVTHGRTMGMAPGRPAGVGMVPSGPVRTGFGGAQGSSVPLGVAGLTLMLGGTTLLARRRIRTGARS